MTQSDIGTAAWALAVGSRIFTSHGVCNRACKGMKVESKGQRPAGKGVAVGLQSFRSKTSLPNMKRPSSVTPQCMFCAPSPSRAASTLF